MKTRHCEFKYSRVCLKAHPFDLRLAAGECDAIAEPRLQAIRDGLHGNGNCLASSRLAIDDRLRFRAGR
jgi:hypothetical protein